MSILGFFRKRNKVDHDAVKARLAAVETLGLLGKSVEQSQGADKAAVIARLKKALNYTTDGAADQVLDALLRLLRDSEVNINFNAANFFADYAKSPTDKYATKFEIMRKAGAPMGNARDDAEAKMFHYKTIKSADSASKGEKEAIARINKYGALDSADFKGVIRPRYCTLNFADLKDGFGAQWGRSHFVLSSHLKPNMSFTHTDSFDITGGKSTPQSVQAQLCTYHNMTRLLRYMPDVMLDIVIDAMSGEWQKGMTCEAMAKKYKIGSTLYVEGHTHAELYFKRDFKEVRVCETELDKDGPLLRKSLAAFQAKNQLKISFFQ